MTVLDLGELEGPVLCFGGPYSNAQATEAVLSEAKARGIPEMHIICTGDTVAYGGDPVKTVDVIRDSGIHVVMGNCEESLGFKSPNCNCGFEDESACAHWSDIWFTHAQSRLNEDARAWMRDLPRLLRFTLSGRRFAVIHGGAANISEYIFASTPEAAKAKNFEALDKDEGIDGVIGGHSGLPFTQLTAGGLWHNPGAIGMPANDGTPRGWCSVLTPQTDAITVSLMPLNYDHHAAQAAADAMAPDLPYGKTLSDGLWPDMSVLPEAERRLRGLARAAESIYWPHRQIAAAE